MKGIGYLLAIIFVGTFGRNFFPLDEEIYWLGEAVSWVLVGAYLYRTSERYVKIVSIFMTICWISNLADEIFFNPYELTIDKHLVACFAALTSIFLALKLWVKENNYTFSFRKLKLIKCNNP